MNLQPLALEALSEFVRTYPQPVMGRAHRVFLGRDEIAVIEVRPRTGEYRRFLVDVITRVGLPVRYFFALRDDGAMERQDED